MFVVSFDVLRYHVLEFYDVYALWNFFGGEGILKDCIILMYHWIMHLWIVKEFVFLVKMCVEGKKQWTWC